MRYTGRHRRHDTPEGRGRVKLRSLRRRSRGERAPVKLGALCRRSRREEHGMRRRMDAYLEPLVEPERFAFYQAVCDFADKEIAPELLTWERQHCLLPEKALQAIADL